MGENKVHTGTATVVKNTGSHYLLSELPLWKPFNAVVRGKLRLSGSTATNPVAVGDRVEYSVPVGSDGRPTDEATITKERTTSSASPQIYPGSATYSHPTSILPI